MIDICINGKFLSQNLTGVQRYAVEIIKAIDNHLNDTKIKEKYNFIIIAPSNLKYDFKFKNIKIRKVGLLKGTLWEQIELPYYSRNKFLLNFCNVAPIIKKNQIVTIHDAATAAMPKSFSMVFKLWYRFMYFILEKRLNKIFTVSNFAKNQVNKYFNFDKNKIIVTYNGIEHIFRIKPDNEILKKFSIEKCNYILAVSSLNPSKNFKLVLECAKYLSDYKFIIAGRKNTTVFKNENLEIPQNVNFIGYVSDEELVALYRNAYCFVYPSLYEGFGIPPLEAIALGCPVILSNIEVFKEIYNDNAVYCDSNNAKQLASKIQDNESLDKLRNVYLTNNDLHKYSWNKTVKKIFDYLP